MGYNSQRYLSYMYQINYIFISGVDFWFGNQSFHIYLFIYVFSDPFILLYLLWNKIQQANRFLFLNSTIKYTLPNYYHQLNIIGFKPILIYYWSDTNIICTFWIFGVHYVPIIRYIYIGLKVELENVMQRSYDILI